MALSVGELAGGGHYAEPMMIRVYNGEHKGATAFFRNRPFLDAFFSALGQRCERRAKILVHASSVGAEPYSLALWWLHRILPQWKGIAELDIAATDVDPGFLAFARQGVYPGALLTGMSNEEQSWFAKDGDKIFVPSEARRLVRFLEPMSFVDGNPGEEFDAVLVMNALTYVSPHDQATTLEMLASYTRHLMGVTAFHPDSIRTDLIRSGFEPYEESHREIHEAWGDRLAKGPVSPNSPDYSWRLPPYDDLVVDYLYRFGSLFVCNGERAAVVSC